jgi:hypothetical protein
MAIADVDGDGLIDYNEFVAATMHVSKLEKEELLQKVCTAACCADNQGQMPFDHACQHKHTASWF